MTASHYLRAPFRHIGRNLIAYVALFLALGGTSMAAGKLLTGADIQDDSLTGADVVESSLAKVPGASDADQLGGTPATEFMLLGGNAGGDLSGTYPRPGLADGAAATNIWGKNQWAPAGATQRGYLAISRYRVDGILVGGIGTISYPVPLAPGASLQSHVIEDGDAPPAGCGGTIAEPTAEPGHLCVFYSTFFAGEAVADLSAGSPLNRYGRLLRLEHDGDGSAGGFASAAAVWAMTAPKAQQRG